MAARLNLEQQIEATNRSTLLLNRGDCVAVAVSGGPDSVALLSILVSLASTLDFTVSAIHLDHGLRGACSEEDANFVKRLCDRLHIAVTVKKLGLKKRLNQITLIKLGIL